MTTTNYLTWQLDDSKMPMLSYREDECKTLGSGEVGAPQAQFATSSHDPSESNTGSRAGIIGQPQFSPRFFTAPVVGPGGWGLGPGAWGLGAGAWGLGAGGWGLGPHVE